MFSEKACSLIRDLNRNKENIPPYNLELLTEIGNEVIDSIQKNKVDLRSNADTSASSSGITSLIPTATVRHAAIERNVRCILAYHYHRVRVLRTMRWDFGSILPTEIKANLSPSESRWFGKYSVILAKYMRSIGDDTGVNLSVDLKPPKVLYVEVRCLVDYGKFELNSGVVILLKKNTRHYLPRTECEELIRQGVVEHVIN